MASLAFCVALAMMTSAISSIAEATDAGDWYVDLGKSENNGVILYQWEFLRDRLGEGEGLPWIAME